MAFSTEALVAKLKQLTATQQSIEVTSQWLLFHRNHAGDCVSTWAEQLAQAPASRRLSFLYLANDVIQHSKRRSGNYAREFETILPGVFGTTLNGLDHDTKGKIYRILEVWRERNVYEPQFLDLLAAKAKLDTIGAAQSHTHASHHPHGRHQMPQNQLATAAAPLPKPSVPLAPALGRTPKNTGLAKSVKFAPDTKPGHEYDDNALARAQESDSGAGAVESASLLVPEVRDLSSKLQELIAVEESTSAAATLASSLNLTIFQSSTTATQENAEAVKLLTDHIAALNREIGVRTAIAQKLRDLLAQHDSALWERRTRLKPCHRAILLSRILLQVAEDQLAQLESTAQRAEPADDDGLAAINAKSAILVGATAPSGLLSSMPSTNTLSDPQSSGAAAISAEGASTIGHDGFGTSDFAAAFVNDGFSGGNHQATLDRISLTWPDDNPLGFDL
ncbi:hypothetical protein HK105_200620 [Polyrhizophydium stewartii]|uniref:CID domain-containing protein n=1 Tax=Polyrhizophydium stewartii TaxID=2732419 RepID=A0ABR4NJM6_9FUNG